MDGLDRWDWLLLLLAVYVAVVGIVRLMAARRTHVIGELQSQWKRQQGRADPQDAERTKPQDEQAA
ncbi:MAG: hypothetical protein ACC645_18875 [Pirellulales bacterium]